MRVLFTLLSAVMMVLQAPVGGTIRDATGAAIAGAEVVVRSLGGDVARTASGPDGRFAVDAPEGALTLVVQAAGFAATTRTLAAGEDRDGLEIVLEPAALHEEVTVTPTRSQQALAAVPASVHVLDGEAIRQSPAQVADDLLRQVPTFSLFRRTSSVSSHPTTQGVSLRGIGPSGVSRTLVLLDGVPFNDPFGGWVYWTRVPLENAERIEVVDGTTSNLYGNYAMGGVINVVTRQPVRPMAELKAQAGSQRNPKIALAATGVRGRVGALLSGSWYRTDGFPVVIANERGPIDTNATLEYRNLDAKIDYAPADAVRAFFRAGYFAENRGNGKILEVNDTRWIAINGGARVRLPDASTFEVSASGDFERFHSTFLAVVPGSATIAPRSVVRLTVDQNVPTDAAGGAAVWSRPFAGAHTFSAGADFRTIDGDSREDAFGAAPGPVTPPVQASTLTLRRVSGGRQHAAGFFVQDVVAAAGWTLTLGARVDRWTNGDAHNFETGVPSGVPTGDSRALPETAATVASPRVGALFRASERVRIWGSLGSGFRAPTLNELYRQFRVGTVLTLANAQLGPERLLGGEAGITMTPARGLTIRTAWYDNRVTNAVSNVTIGSSGPAVTQQRQNLGRTRIRGLQADVDFRTGAWRLAGGFLVNHARVAELGANPALAGRRLPQVPTYRGSARLAYDRAPASVSMGVQYVGRQFDDDLNVRVVPGHEEPGLPAYATADATISWTLGRRFDLYAGVQNLFDTTYIVGTLPTTIGSPRLVDAGVRIRFAGW
ncbi:MAG: TonB-dependent receptor [Acidobacteria bacterium]|nr:TonB-dependent receptor [Acidobacteriota bacterium]